MRTETELPELPRRGTSAYRARRIFEQHAEAILREWEGRKARPVSRRAESPNAWFKREAFRLLAYYIENGFGSTFRSVVRHDRRPSRLVEDALKNPFKAGMLAMFSDESPLSRVDRHTFGNQMLFAWQHDVPPDFLNAFLAVSGGAAVIAKKIRDGVAEPGFEHRFNPSRRLSPASSD